MPNNQENFLEERGLDEYIQQPLYEKALPNETLPRSKEKRDSSQILQQSQSQSGSSSSSNLQPPTQSNVYLHSNQLLPQAYYNEPPPVPYPQYPQYHKQYLPDEDNSSNDNGQGFLRQQPQHQQPQQNTDFNMAAQYYSTLPLVPQRRSQPGISGPFLYPGQLPPHPQHINNNTPMLIPYNNQPPPPLQPQQLQRGPNQARSNSIPQSTILPKRTRRKRNEVERLYFCNYADCTKGYGSLSHLNGHIVKHGHGKRRHPEEFTEIRKFIKERDEAR